MLYYHRTFLKFSWSIQPDVQLLKTVAIFLHVFVSSVAPREGKLIFKCLLYARHCDKCFLLYNISFVPHSKRKARYPCPHFTDEDIALEALK